MDVDVLNEPKPNSSAITSMSRIGRGTLARRRVKAVVEVWVGARAEVAASCRHDRDSDIVPGDVQQPGAAGIPGTNPALPRRVNVALESQYRRLQRLEWRRGHPPGWRRRNRPCRRSGWSRRPDTSFEHQRNHASRRSEQTFAQNPTQRDMGASRKNGSIRAGITHQRIPGSGSRRNRPTLVHHEPLKILLESSWKLDERWSHPG
jgi:hypothetical protein